MNSFKNYLIESSLSSGSLSKAKSLIQSYLSKKTGIKLFSMAGLEKFSNGFGSGIGIRYFIPKNGGSIRFNWKSQSSNEHNLSSIDIWKSGGKADWHIDFDEPISLVQVLPMIADVLKGKETLKKGDIALAPMGTSLNEEFAEFSELYEAFDASSAYDDIVKMIKTDKFNQSKVYRSFATAGMKLLHKMVEMHPELFDDTRGIKYIGDKNGIKTLSGIKQQVLTSAGAAKAKVSSGSKDSYDAGSDVEALENDRERIAFEEQLADMEKLIKMMVAGASNALFVAGRGGIGKTHTVEQVLSDLGLSDGKGYFKNTGSASAAGVYSLLFKYKDQIVFFDDSDDALKDQESRNIFKAATDTKPKRKLVWNKRGSNVVDPDDDMSDEEILDAGKIPQFFEFTGKVIFISNLPMNKLDPDGALRTRAFMIDIDPTDTEIYEFMEKIVDKIPIPDGMSMSSKRRKEVVNLLRTGTSKQTANLRKLSRGLAMAAGADAQGIGDKEITKMIERYA
jgi:hypothetical protein